jgi:hypothetical protein
MGKRLRLDDVVFAIRESKGLLSVAAERLNCSRRGLCYFVGRHQAAQDALTDARERLVDAAEAGLWAAVLNREPWAIALTLKTLGKFRGFFEPQHLTPAGQCRLPQRDGLHVPDDDWAAPEARQLQRLLKARLEGSAEDEDDAAGEDLWEQQEALIARQHEQLEAQAAQLEAQAARIRELEAATTVSPDDPQDDDDAEVMAEIQRLSRIAADLQRRVNGAS